MATSKYIARLMGPVMLVMGIGMALGLMMEGEAYSSLLKEFIGSRALIFITGILALTAGLAIVNAHNLWVRDWRVIVTILGWLFVLRGIMLLLLSGRGADAWRPRARRPLGRGRGRGDHLRDRRHSLDHGLRGSVGGETAPAERRAGIVLGAQRQAAAAETRLSRYPRARFDTPALRSRLAPFRGEPQGRG
jgi:hypothetical protein